LSNIACAKKNENPDHYEIFNRAFGLEPLPKKLKNT